MIQSHHREVVETGRTVIHEEHQPSLEAYRWSIVIRFPIRNAKGEITVVGGIALDITERKRTEAALRESEARLAAFMDHAPVGMYLKDLEGRYLMLNPEMGRVFDQPPAVMLGREPEFVFTPEEAALIRGYDDEILRTSIPTRYEEFIAANDAYAWSMVIRFPVRDAAGAITQIGGFDLDITQQKRALVELEASEQRFRTIAGVHPAPMLISRLDDRRIVFANRAFTDAFGLEGAKLEGFDQARLYADPAAFAAIHAAATAQGVLEEREVELQPPRRTALPGRADRARDRL